jgi:hypothetical protein
MLQLETAIATLANVNLRIEKVGKEKTRPAADLKFTVNIPNTQLDQISPGLLASLYRRTDEQGHQADLAAGPDAMTTLRHPKAKPWQSTEDWPGYFAQLHAGEFDLKDVELDKVTLKSITCDAKTGGTVELSFSIGCHPTPADVAVLYELMGQDVDLSLNPPALGDLEKLRAEAKKGGNGAAGPDHDDEGEEEDDAPPTDAQAGRAFPDAIDARGDNPPSARRGRGKAAGAPLH